MALAERCTAEEALHRVRDTRAMVMGIPAFAGTTVEVAER
jgi:hypothetical protein